MQHVDARHRLEQLALQMGGGSDTTRRHGELAGIGLGIGDELGDRRRWNREVRYYDVVHTGDAGNRRDVAELVPQPPRPFSSLCASVKVGYCEKTARVIPSRHRTFGLKGVLVADVAAIATPVELTVILGQNSPTEGQNGNPRRIEFATSRWPCAS